MSVEILGHRFQIQHILCWLEDANMTMDVDFFQRASLKMDCISIALFTHRALYMNASDIYPFIHRWQRLLSKLPTCTSGAVGGSVSCSTLCEEESGWSSNSPIAERLLYLLNHYRLQKDTYTQKKNIFSFSARHGQTWIGCVGIVLRGDLRM